ncbi:hypothetical protein BVRB_2g043840 [Beta vulgaris subsp. vulgaris]|nr:hypothetical protein BVRB_2g043840 [Beta vulgaris subsp. vulgaris]
MYLLSHLAYSRLILMYMLLSSSCSDILQMIFSF